MLEKHTGTILKGTNKLITSSLSEVSSLREDSFVVIDDQTNFYKIIGKEKSLYIKDAIVEDQDKLILTGDDRYKFCLNDLITFTHKQYYISSVSVDPDNRGASHKVDDTFNLKFTEGILSSCGTPSVNSYDGSENYPELKISEVDESGKILSLEIVSAGKYNSKPDSRVDFDFGLSLNLEFKTIEKRAMEERVVKSIVNKGHDTIITLDHPLPQNFVMGKASVNKWELLLNINYCGEDNLNCAFTVCKDFTPNCNLPLMHVGAVTNESAYNEAMSILDARVKALEDKWKID